MNEAQKYLVDKARNESKLDQDLIILTVVASLLAVFGIKMNNAFIIIGSMLVSPLFDPLISTIVYITSKDLVGFRKAFRSLFIAISISFLVSFGFWTFLRIAGQLKDYVIIKPDPNIFDVLGVAILMGIVGALLWLWHRTSNTSAGVAIAISLVPPIAYFTAGMTTDNYTLALQYIIIFVLNLLGIFIGSSLTLLLYTRRR